MVSTDRTKIVHIMTVPQSLNNFLRGQVEFVQDRGFEIEAIASPGEWLQKFADRDHVVVHAVDMPRAINPVGDLRAITRLYRALRLIRPEIVQSGTSKGGLLGTVAAWLARTPVRIYHIRGMPFMTETGYKRHLLKWTEKASCRLAHRVLCVSHSIREVAIEEGLCPPEKIVVLMGGSGNGVDARGRYNPARRPANERADVRRQLGIPDDAPVLGFIGRLVRIKGVVELAAMWTLIRQAYPDAHLIAVGPLEDHDSLPEETMATLRNDPRVHLIGSVFDAAPYYSAIDVLVFPTYREGLPNVLLEGAAMEIASVATDVPGCVDVILDGKTGTLVPLGDVPSLEAAVSRYLVDPELRRRHGHAARERVLREFRQEAIWQALVAEYGRLLKAHGLPVPNELSSETNYSLRTTAAVAAD
jgi:glycosyltransferase involved in cell wall biosynthesis